MRSCLWKLSYGFGLKVRLLGLSSPNVVSRPKTPRPKIFLRFYKFIELILWFWRNWGPVWENWSYCSGLWALLPQMQFLYVFWTLLPQMQFKSTRPQGPGFLLNFIILLDSCYDSEENEFLFVKIRTRFLKLWLDTYSGLTWSKFSLQAPKSKTKVFFEMS